MNADEYQKLAMRTAIGGSVNWMNVGLGLTGEAGEVADHIKKVYFQGHYIDNEHLKEELGDVLWYVTLGCLCGGFSLSDLMESNVKKLERRYPNGFSPEASRERTDEEKPTEPIERPRIEWLRILPDRERLSVCAQRCEVCKYESRHGACEMFDCYDGMSEWWHEVVTLEQFRKDVGLSNEKEKDSGTNMETASSAQRQGT